MDILGPLPKAIRAVKYLLMRLGVKHLVTSIEHPQTNGQAETANRVILRAVCTRLDKSKGLWKEDLPIL